MALLSHGWLRQETSVHQEAAGFPGVSEQGTRQKSHVIYDPALEVTLGHFHTILLVPRVSPIQCGRGGKTSEGPSQRLPATVIESYQL